MTWHKTIWGITIIIVLSGCASKFAPVVSRPDNLIIECESTCKFNIPMNTEIVTARNTNGYDMGVALVKQIPFIGALALSWKSMDVAENIAEASIESFNRGRSVAEGRPPQITNNTTSTVTGDTITSGDIISTETDSSGSGNSSSADVAETTTTSTTGDTVGGDKAGEDVDKSVTYDTDTITYPQSP